MCFSSPHYRLEDRRGQGRRFRSTEMVLELRQGMPASLLCCLVHVGPSLCKPVRSSPIYTAGLSWTEWFGSKVSNSPKMKWTLFSK